MKTDLNKSLVLLEQNIINDCYYVITKPTDITGIKNMMEIRNSPKDYTYKISYLTDVFKLKNVIGLDYLKQYLTEV